MNTQDDRQLDMFTTNAGLSQTQQIALQRLIKTLDVLPVQYVIKAVDGSTFSRGDLQVIERKPMADSKIRRSPYPHGELAKYVKPFLGTMRAGDVVLVPVGDYAMKFVAQACSAYACTTWGKGTYITKRTDDGKHVEVLRVAE